MNDPATEYGPGVEEIHRVDPDNWSWNESWFFSWIDVDGGPAGVFRVGITPNQDRAMLWCFVHTDGEWLTVEESRLAYGHFELAKGVAYDRWGIRFSWQPDEPLGAGRFTFDGFALARSGPRSGMRVPLSIDLAYAPSAKPHGTGIGPDEDQTAYPTGRFEQSLSATGTVTVDGRTHRVRAGAHRDKSWGPREWRQMFSMGDLQWPDRQLYFVGRSFPGLAGGYLRDDSGAMSRLTCVDGKVEYDDQAGTLAGPAHLIFETPDRTRLDVSLTPITPSIYFDMAHSCQEPEHWLYWRTLVEARVAGWATPARGWFEAGRHGAAR
jgi:hypothetical protein